MSSKLKDSTDSRVWNSALFVSCSLLLSCTLLPGCSESKGDNNSTTVKHSRSEAKITSVTVTDFGPFAQDLTRKILNYKSDSYESYIDAIKPNMSPKAFKKLKTGKLIPASEQEMKDYASRVDLVSVSESEPVSHDAKTSMVVAKVGFIAKMKFKDNPQNMKSEIVYKLGIKQKTGKPMVVEVGQTNYQKVN